MTLDQIRELARDKVLDAWEVDSIDEGYDRWEDREVLIMIHSTEEFFDGVLNGMNEAEIAVLLREPGVLEDALGFELDLFGAAKTLEDWARLFLRSVLMEGM